MVKIDQNKKNSENWEKIQFFDTLTTFVAQQLMAPAQIEKKVDFFVLHRFSDCLIGKH